MPEVMAYAGFRTDTVILGMACRCVPARRYVCEMDT